MAFIRTFKAQARVISCVGFKGQRPLSIVGDGPVKHRSELQDAIKATDARNAWSKQDIEKIYNTPLMELVFAAVRFFFYNITDAKGLQGTIHRRFHDPSTIQMCTLLNIKTGGCSEDCSYCAQSTRYAKDTGLKATKLVSVELVLEAAKKAKENGSTRFCMGAAWRDMRGRKSGLKTIKDMVSGVRAMDMEVCVTLGMIDDQQAKELKDAGLTAYNHNLDTSREFYPEVITTRSYDERLATIKHVSEAGINVCTGGILGLGEKPKDHIGLIYTVANLPEHPESFPVNALVPIRGTPLGDRKPIAFDAILRTVATARSVMPKTIIRLAAGRINLNEEQQALCFLAGANAVFTGDKMLTTDCNGWGEDQDMFRRWGLIPMKSFERAKFQGFPLLPERSALEGNVHHRDA